MIFDLIEWGKQNLNDNQNRMNKEQEIRYEWNDDKSLQLYK